jgi:pyridoxamine 5'-phosphate oxidase
MDLSTLSTLRREYGHTPLSEENASPDPLKQFESWLNEVLATGYPDATAMTLATTDPAGHPDTRIVLLKGLDTGFIFYTNYQSAKGKQIEKNPVGALNFYWFIMVRQVRIRGVLEKMTRAENERYFHSRPRDSQISAIISPQSQQIIDRNTLESKISDYSNSAPDIIPCPDYWGGYRLIPNELEFFQGRDARCHDRLHYLKKGGAWEITRLAP